MRDKLSISIRRESRCNRLLEGLNLRKGKEGEQKPEKPENAAMNCFKLNNCRRALGHTLQQEALGSECHVVPALFTPDCWKA